MKTKLQFIISLNVHLIKPHRHKLYENTNNLINPDDDLTHRHKLYENTNNLINPDDDLTHRHKLYENTNNLINPDDDLNMITHIG